MHFDVDKLRIIQWRFTVQQFEEIILHYYQLRMTLMHADHLDGTTPAL